MDRGISLLLLPSLAVFWLLGASALDNGLGLTPPRGWRSWDAFLSSVNQTLQQRQVDALVDKSRLVDGRPTSLLELGYNRIGLDDAWQDCGKGVNGSFHDATGRPLINPKKFPDMRAMNDYARSRGIGSGWYLNSCDCCERGALRPNWPAQMRGDADAIRDLGFDGLKVDSCGPSQDLAEWARLLNQSGRPVLLENCFDNASFPYVVSGADDGDERIEEDACPMNTFRTGGDMRAQWPLMLERLQAITPWLRLSRPGCWAYLDMLEVGNPPGGTGEQRGFENVHSWRAHFGAWAITSSPLILSFDLTNRTKLDLCWDFITNREALEVNAAWAGEAGRLVSSTYDQTAPTPVFARPCSSGVDTQKFVLTSEGLLRSNSTTDSRCVSVPSCPAEAPQTNSGTLGLGVCDGSPSQDWTLTGDSAEVTNVRSEADGGCWEIEGCGGPSLDTNYGCKPLPKGPLPCAGQCCNMAWTFHENGSIVSGMPARTCVQVSPADERTVISAPCTGSPRELWRRNGSTIRPAAGAGCIDSRASKPVNPQYGPLVVADCAKSACGGADHRWTYDVRTGQLVSGVAGAQGQRICAEVQSYGNHNAGLSAVDCAPAASVPKSQQFAITRDRERVSVDVRFDATQQRSPGMLLCVDIYFGTRPNGAVGPGSRLITQVWAKRLSETAVAVLFLNADMEAAHDISVDLAGLGFSGGPVTVRDVWRRTDLGIVPRAGSYSVKAIPPQDSSFLIFRSSRSVFVV